MSLHALASALLPDSIPFSIESVALAGETLDVTVVSRQTSGMCPQCQRPATRRHSRYRRHPADLPWGGRTVRWQLQLHRWFCDTAPCPKRTFVEQLPRVLAPWARRTARLASAQTELAFTAGGNPGTRLAVQLAMPVSRSTLIRMIRRAPPPPTTCPRVVSVDDWCKRKGATYGSIVVDLEQHRPLDLLDDRSSESWAAWLQTHPGVEIISRDRATAYATGSTLGAPDAIQVADRFHLIQNFRTACEEELKLHPEWIRVVNADLQPPVPPSIDDHSPPAPKRTPDAARQRRRQERMAQFAQVKALHQDGMRRVQIAQVVGISPRLVDTWVPLTQFPERKPRTGDSSRLEPYYAFLTKRWEAGYHNAKRLWHDVQQQGYPGGYRTVALFCRRLRHGERPTVVAAASAAPQRTSARRGWSARQLSFLLVRPREKWADDAQQAWDVWYAHPEAGALARLGAAFLAIVRERRADALDEWLTQALHSPWSALHRFAEGIERDKAAVVAALTLEWSSGQTEGQITRLKLLKRAMYGRAKLDVLRQRVLHAA